MKKLNLYKHYVVRDNVMVEIEKKDVRNNEPLLYIGSTPTTPSDIEFVFGYKRDVDFWNGEISYELGYLYEEHSKNKLIEMSKQINN